MCGITGIVCPSQSLAENYLNSSESVQIHRGTDFQSSEIITAGDWCLGLGHQRLSVIDLTDNGNQPMHSKSRRSVISYNGEVYNYQELSKKYSINLDAGGSDTKIIVELIEKIGIKDALNQFNGMWAFAWYDKKKNKLFLARDRVGIKPIYYFLSGKSLYFASEIKAILNASRKKFKLDFQVIGEYLLQSLQDCTDATFFKQIRSVPPGHFVEIDLNKKQIGLKISPFWELSHKVSNLTFEKAQEKLKETFTDAVRLRMRSDVPIGVTLSGGLDSSAIASQMQKLLSEDQKLSVISAVFPGFDNDESQFIDVMSEYLNQPVEKVKITWKPNQTLNLLEEATWFNDAPLGSFSNVALYLLMKKANELGITVILSGQGADELLCGYKKYLVFYFQYLARNFRFFSAIRLLITFFLNKSIINQFSRNEAKRYLPTFFVNKEIDLKGPALKNFVLRDLRLRSGQTVNQRQIDDLKKFSVPYLTHYEDRMSMAWTREIRLPFLDYRMIELLVSLPIKFKIASGWTKFIFRKSFENLLPQKIVWRKDKQGFLSPQETWLRKELKPEILKVFNEDALIFSLGIVKREALLQKYGEFCKQKDNRGGIWYREVFNPLALEIWLQQRKEYIKH